MIFSQLKPAAAMALVVCLSLKVCLAIAQHRANPEKPSAEKTTPAKKQLAARASDVTNHIRKDQYGDPLPPRVIARIGTVRFRQPFVGTVAYTPDGKYLASGGGGNRGTLYFWDPKTGQKIRSFNDHKGSVNDLSFSRDGKRLLAGDQMGDLFLWDVSSGKILRRLKGSPTCIYHVALSPNGRFAAASGFNTWLCLWDTNSGQKLQQFQKEGGYHVSAIAFSPDNRMIAFSFHYRIHVWQIHPWKELRVLAGHRYEIGSLIFAVDGRHLLSSSLDGTVRVWNLPTGKEVRRFRPKQEMFGAMALTPGGKTVAVIGKNGRIYLWNWMTGKERTTGSIHAKSLRAVAFSLDRKSLAGVNVTSVITVWDVATGNTISPVARPTVYFFKVFFSADGKSLLTELATIQRTGSDNLIWWDISSGKRKRRWPRESKLRTYFYVLNPRRTRLATVEWTAQRSEKGPPVPNGRHIAVWDLTTDKKLCRLPIGQQWPRAILFFPDGKRLLAQFDRQMIVWNLPTGEEVFRKKLSSRLSALALSPDGHTLICVDEYHIQLLNTHTWQLAKSFDKQPYHRGRFFTSSPNGKTLVWIQQRAGGYDGPPKICLWELASGGLRRCLKVPRPWLNTVAFSPNGRILACAGVGGEIHLWDLSTNKELAKLKGHLGRVDSLDFSPDGKNLVSSSVDTTILVWDVADLVFPKRSPEKKLTQQQLTDLWRDLASLDAEKAYRAMWTLANHPRQAVPYLANHPNLNEAAKKAQRIRKFIRDLDSNSFHTREKAFMKLAKLGKDAEQAMREALAKTPSLEAAVRMRDLLKRIKTVSVDTAMLRRERLIEALEHMGTPEAKKLLQFCIR